MSPDENLRKSSFNPSQPSPPMKNKITLIEADGLRLFSKPLPLRILRSYLTGGSGQTFVPCKIVATTKGGKAFFVTSPLARPGRWITLEYRSLVQIPEKTRAALATCAIPLQQIGA